MSVGNLIPAFNKAEEGAQPTRKLTDAEVQANGGRQRRRIRRAIDRAETAQQRKGERRYNRQQRKLEFDAQTVRMQLGILKGEIPATPAMVDNLTRHIQRAERLHNAKLVEPQRKAEANTRRLERLRQRQQARLDAGLRRHGDLIAAFGDY